MFIHFNTCRYSLNTLTRGSKYIYIYIYIYIYDAEQARPGKVG